MSYHPVSEEDGKEIRHNTPMTNDFNYAPYRRSNGFYGSSHASSARYFEGPRNLEAHSKIPMFLRLHGSVMPRMIVPLSLLCCWTTLVTYISHYYVSLTAEPILVTVLGLVVGLSLSFRSSSAYERYSEGRKSWATLMVQSRTLARLIWVHVPERPNTDDNPECSKEDLLSKVSAINLILAFAVALKHRLRFEPYAHYPDLAPLIGHLEIFAKRTQDSRTQTNENLPVKISIWKRIGGFLSLSFAISNPRKAVNKADGPLGNLPLEILTYLSAFVQNAATETPGPSLVSPVVFTQLLNSLTALTDVEAQTDRILNTPLPIAYNILISQLVYLYTYLLPFQLFDKFRWVTLPATLAASYIIMGIAAIGNELENPFGNDVNDLPLDTFCDELRQDLDFQISQKPHDFKQTICSKENIPLWPISLNDYNAWYSRDEKNIRDVLRVKAFIRST